MTGKHYENFPVASLALPKSLRRPVGLIYSFARQADDFADEGEIRDEERIRLLSGFRSELERIVDEIPPQTELFHELAVLVREHSLPIDAFFDLLEAFAQDVHKKRYADFPEILAYCRKSADPVGRLLLALYGVDSESNRFLSDKICSSLQLINFLQDVAIDHEMGRIYLPLDEMRDANISEAQIASGDTGGSWQAFMKRQSDRARAMMLEGAPLANEMKGRLSLEMKMIVLGGLKILDRLEQCRWDVFRRRPKLGRRDWILIVFDALFGRIPVR